MYPSRTTIAQIAHPKTRDIAREMKGRVYASCLRSSMIYGSETKPLLAGAGLKFEREAERRVKN